MRKELTIPQPAVWAPELAWTLLGVELLAAGLLSAFDRLPEILLRSLQIFLRF